MAYDTPRFERFTWGVRAALFLMHTRKLLSSVLFSRTTLPPPLVGLFGFEFLVCSWIAWWVKEE